MNTAASELVREGAKSVAKAIGLWGLVVVVHWAVAQFHHSVCTPTATGPLEWVYAVAHTALYTNSAVCNGMRGFLQNTGNVIGNGYVLAATYIASRLAGIV